MKVLKANRKSASESVNLTIKLPANLMKRLRKIAESRGLTVSTIVRKHLKWITSPYVICFGCGRKLSLANSRMCVSCYWIMCPHCGVCGCSIGDDARSRSSYWRKLIKELLQAPYEDLVKGYISPDERNQLLAKLRKKKQHAETTLTHPSCIKST